MTSLDEPTKHPSTWIVWLDCDCARTILAIESPRIGDEYYCYRHHRAVWVTEVGTEYNVRCLDCSSRRNFGLAKLSASMFASKHHRNQPTHRIQVRRGLTVIEIRVARNLLQELPFEVDDPPF